MFKNLIIKCFCEDKDIIPGGLADNKTLRDVLLHHHPDLSPGSKAFITTFHLLKKQFEKGKKVEKEHTDDSKIAEEIALDHIWEDESYYDKLEDVESSH